MLLTICFASLSCLASQFTQQTEEPVTLRVDPRLLAQAAEVWEVAGRADNPIWPGWDVSETPLLFYFPGVQDVLVNHPSVPAGFRAYTGPLSFPGWEIAVRDGETIIGTDGQNTSLAVFGVQTLVVADPLSNLRPNLLSWAGSSESSADREDSLTFSLLTADPYDGLGMILHEAFHVYQSEWGAGRTGNELALLSYPCLSVDNNVGFALEAQMLADALQADDEEERWIGALRWLAVRKDRRSKLSSESIAYEDGTEFNEGLAKYTEWALTYALQDKEPSAHMGWLRSFSGYGDMEDQRTELLAAMRGFLSGEHVVNNDPYGTAPVRFRLYYSGMAIGALLDGLRPDWKVRMMESGTTLTGLVEDALQPHEEDLATALAEVFSTSRTPALVAAKEELQRKGLAVAIEKLESLQSGEGTLLTVDYSALVDANVGFSFTPFGITRIDEDRVLYEMVPISARISTGNEIEQTHASPLLHDTARSRISFKLRRGMSPQELAAAIGIDELTDAPLESVSCDLPGVALHLDRVGVSVQRHEVTFTLK